MWVPQAAHTRLQKWRPTEQGAGASVGQGCAWDALQHGNKSMGVPHAALATRRLQPALYVATGKPPNGGSRVLSGPYGSGPAWSRSTMAERLQGIRLLQLHARLRHSPARLNGRTPCKASSSPPEMAANQSS